MFVVRSILNGVGTGAGVAWPLFGIVASTLCLSPVAALPLAVVCAVLFCMITAFVALTSYRNSIQEYRQLNQNVERQANQLLINLYELFSSSQLQPGNGAWVRSLVQHPLVAQSGDAIQGALSEFLLNHQREFSRYPSLSARAKRMLLNHWMLSLCKEHRSLHIFTNQGFAPAFLAFVGAFGSVAGCGAGMMGLLSTVGVISGFSALPLIGLILVTMAITTGAYRAHEALVEAIGNERRAALHTCIEQLNAEFLTFNALPQSDEHQPAALSDASNDVLSEQPRIANIIYSNRFRGTLFNPHRPSPAVLATDSAEDDDYASQLSFK